MKHDIHKLGDWLEQVCREGIAVERKVLEWKLSTEKKMPVLPESKAS